jgi:MoaA/NifB/PqqE/SkfB family radical SAM enzyme
MVTTYPVGFDYTKLDILAKKYQAPYSRFVEESDNVIDGNEVLYTGTIDKIKHLSRHPFDLDKKVPNYEFIDCYHFNKCITLREGKLYPCPIIPHSRYFNAYFGQDLKIDKGDYIDIHSAKNFSEISEFLSERVPFCGYCAVSRREGGMEFTQSKRDINEWL